MCLIQDFNNLDKVDERSIIEYVEKVCGYVVIPQKTVNKIEDVLERSSKLAFDKGRITLHQDIKAVLPK